MKTAINGKLRLKWFWGCMYSGSGMTPVERICKIGKLILAKVVYSTENPFSADYYKASVLKELQKYYNVVWENAPNGSDTDKMWHYVYSKIDGGQVGRPEEAYRFLQRGIEGIQKAKSEDKVCSIGYFCPKGTPIEKQRWYGWSHRAMCSFGIGDVVKKGDCCASSGWTDEYLQEHPEEDLSLPIGFKAETLADARRMAVAFAESVG
ncbi:MAG: hypothetical protein ACYSSI_00345 [Planctomycetota bacterium]|jgi:hypothetical protein